MANSYRDLRRDGGRNVRAKGQKKNASQSRSLHTVADVTGPARIIDGDLLEVAAERIRLHGIDAPESRQLCFNEPGPGCPLRRQERAAELIQSSAIIR